ncbi:hypothetical protein CEE34_08240 [Candidatus Aerophobetes bacterium Ae_b3a]|nr:MAG: hypothetical protein CEE34_08240 [Candidatus Aerophobetes bacterium Ae_b3a]
MRIKKNILSEEQGDDALPFLELGGSRPKAVEGGCFPLQSLLYLSRNEKLSRNNRRLLYSDGRNCSSVIDLSYKWAIILGKEDK